MEWRHSFRTGPVRCPENEAGSADERVKARAANLRDETAEKARDFAQQKKSVGAERMASLSRAMRTAAGQLEADMPMAASYMQTAASRLEQASTDMRDQSVDEILNTARDFARRQPALLFGGAVFAGMLLARFLKSSATDQREGSARAIGGNSSRGSGHVH